MSAPLPQSEHSLGIAQSLAESFFPAFNGNKEALPGFFSEEASLVFQGSKESGIKEITDFLNDLPNLEINITSFDVQTIQSPKSWTMIVYTGSFLAEGDEIKDFHSSIFVEANESAHTAFIRYMTFNYF